MFTSFMCLAQQAKLQTATKTIYNNNLLEMMTGELTVKHLHQLYGTALRASKTAQDKLIANTGGDRLEIFQNKYNAFLLSANFTSHQLAFGRGIRVGATKLAFCKAFGLNPVYDSYRIVENPEGGYDLTFRFKQGSLAEVIYRVNYTD